MTSIKFILMLLLALVVTQATAFYPVRPSTTGMDDSAGVPTMPPPSRTTLAMSTPTTFQTSTLRSSCSVEGDASEAVPTITQAPSALEKRGLPKWLQWLTDTESDYPNHFVDRFRTQKVNNQGPRPPPPKPSWTNSQGLVCHKHVFGLFQDCPP